MGVFPTNYSIPVFLTRVKKSDYLTAIPFNKLSCQLILHIKTVVTTRYRNSAPILTSGFDLIFGSFIGLFGSPRGYIWFWGDFVLGDYFLREFCPMDFFTFEFWGILS